MKVTWKGSPQRSVAVTLVEVVVGLALMAGVVVSLLCARTRLLEERARAEAKLRAVSAARDLLVRWWQVPVSLPRTGAGEIEATDFRWRTETLERYDLRPLGAALLRLEILNAKPQLPPKEPPEPILTLELIVPGRTEEETSR